MKAGNRSSGRGFRINKGGDGTDAVSCVLSDGGVAGVQNDDPRLSPPAGHSTRRSATAASKYHHEVN